MNRHDLILRAERCAAQRRVGILKGDSHKIIQKFFGFQIRSIKLVVSANIGGKLADSLGDFGNLLLILNAGILDNLRKLCINRIDHVYVVYAVHKEGAIAFIVNNRLLFNLGFFVLDFFGLGFFFLGSFFHGFFNLGFFNLGFFNYGFFFVLDFVVHDLFILDFVDFDTFLFFIFQQIGILLIIFVSEDLGGIKLVKRCCYVGILLRLLSLQGFHNLFWSQGFLKYVGKPLYQALFHSVEKIGSGSVFLAVEETPECAVIFLSDRKRFVFRIKLSHLFGGLFVAVNQFHQVMDALFKVRRIYTALSLVCIIQRDICFRFSRNDFRYPTGKSALEIRNMNIGASQLLHGYCDQIVVRRKDVIFGIYLFAEFFVLRIGE